MYRISRTIKQHVSDFDPNLINIDETDYIEELAELMFPDEMIDEIMEETINDTTPGPKPLLHAEVYLDHGDRQEIAKVIGRKRNADGNYIGRKNQNPILDSRVFIAEFPDGDQRDITYNLLAEHLFSQVDSEGNQYRLFNEIIGHRNNKASDQWRMLPKSGK
jgi:hypothetical protein